MESCIEHIRSLKPDSVEGVDMQWPIQLFVGNVINETLFNFGYGSENFEPMQRFVIELQKFFDLMK